jgi:ATP-dependent RNA circularization protein (DNA/RNA ligase family)
MLELKEENLKQGVLGLVLALVEIIRDTLRLQAFKRMESGSLTEEECEKLGAALLELDRAIEEIKMEHGVAEAIQTIRDGLDNIADEVLDRLINPERWTDETED